MKLEEFEDKLSELIKSVYASNPDNLYEIIGIVEIYKLATLRAVIDAMQEGVKKNGL